MAGIVIDSLIVTLGLDQTKFDQGQKDAVAGLKKIEDQATRSNAAVETGSKGVGEAFDAITKKAMGFIAIVAGGRSFEQLFVGAVQSSAAIGRLAGNINMATSALSGWQNAARANGGTEQGIANALTAASQGMQAYQYGQATPFIMGMQALGLKLSDDPAQMMTELADALHAMPKSRAMYVAGQMGIDQDTFNFLDQGGAAVSAQVAKSQNTTGPEAAAAIALTKSYANLQTNVEGLSKVLMMLSAPTLTSNLNFLASEIELITDVLSGKISWDQAKQDFVTGLDAIGVVGDASGLGAPATGGPNDYSRGGNSVRNRYSVTDDQWNNQLNQESGGRQLDTSGNPLLGPQTKYGRAVGEAQLLPSTAQQVAKDNGVPWDQNKFLTDPAYNSMLGRLYMNQLMVKYRGDYSKALAAYNWGPGNLDQDISANGNNWLNFAPSQTQNYVRGVTGVQGVLSQLRAQQGKQSSNTTTVHVGSIQVNSPYADPNKVAQQVGRSLQSTLISAAANTGLA